MLTQGKLEESDKKKGEELLLGAAKRGNERARNILLKLGIVPVLKDVEDDSHVNKKTAVEGQEEGLYSPESKILAKEQMPNFTGEDEYRMSNIKPTKVVDSSKLAI